MGGCCFRGDDWTLSRIFRERIDVQRGRVRLTYPRTSSLDSAALRARMERERVAEFRR